MRIIKSLKNINILILSNSIVFKIIRIDCIFFLVLLLALNSSCKDHKNNDSEEKDQETKLITEIPKDFVTPEGMVWIPGKSFLKGAVPDDTLAMDHEKPAHRVAVDGFFIDVTEVTNAQFKKFVEETGYQTLAERKIDWNRMKQELPPGTEKPADSVLQPGSLIFIRTSDITSLDNYTKWWKWQVGADWKHPTGPESSIDNKDDYPVVHIGYEDAIAYCIWANKRLPTEAEWELASRGNNLTSVYHWGNSDKNLSKKANTWNGIFPKMNTTEDGYENISPVKSYPPNSLGLYDMAGNVWEWTQDWYSTRYYTESLKNELLHNPKGPEEPFNPVNPYSLEKVIKGGSYLCNKSYCASYRNSARMGSSINSSSVHVGFRTVVSLDMLQDSENE